MARSGRTGEFAWVVVHDPLGVGAFEEDTVFSEQDVVHGLIFHTWTLGTVFRNHRYGEFTIGRAPQPDKSLDMKNHKYIARTGDGTKLRMIDLTTTGETGIGG